MNPAGATLQCGPGLEIQTFAKPVPLKTENSPQNICSYTDIFYSARRFSRRSVGRSLRQSFGLSVCEEYAFWKYG